jgi:uncharacterized repeat protein (TIGR03803 family)
VKHLYSLVGTGLCAASLAACGGSNGLSSSTPLSVSPQTAPSLVAPLTTEKVLYSFAGGTDAGYPVAGPIDLGGILYGTTYYGGRRGSGTVYQVTTSGAESVLHSFAGGSDGASPDAGLTKVDGTLYGTTRHRGIYNEGTVFSVTTSGTEKVLHAFAGGSDGKLPFADLIYVNGTLYGTTNYGGTSNNGTVFSITTSGTEKIVYSFAGGSDGAKPIAGLTNLNGTLYGTTQYGGGTPCFNGSGCGIVFKVTTSGVETVLHRFAGGSDGRNPQGNMINVEGELYGTTEYGGGPACSGLGCGTVFKITTAGSESVLYSFAGPPFDGAYPRAALIHVGGKLYGTTYAGGYNELGTVFMVLKDGKETELHSFANKPDGANPNGTLIDVGGTLYSTTIGGGTSGWGTVFSIVP